jgi:hypothetical protein
MSTIPLPFSSPLITPNFYATLVFFRQFSTWAAFGDVDRRFAHILARNASAVEE